LLNLPWAVAARWARKADAARDRGEWRLAVANYRAYLALRPRDHDRRIQYGHALKESGKLTEAKAAYLRALEAKRGSADLNLQLGHLHKLMSDFTVARRYYERARQLEPSSHDALRELESLPPPVSAAPSDDLSAVETADAARDRGEWAAAAESYTLHLEAHPQDGPIWEQLGHALREQGDLSGALEAYQHAMEVQAETIGPRRHFAHVAKALGLHEKAVASFIACLIAEPSDEESYRELEALGERERALEALRKCAPEPRRKPSSAPGRKIAIFTIASNNYLPMAEVLLESAAGAYPEADLFLCLADRRTDPDLNVPETAELLLAAEVGIPGFDAFAFRYGPTEFHTALKPFVFEYLLRDRCYERVIYFDPDIKIFRRSGQILQDLDRGAPFVLTPHFREALPFRRLPDTQTILRAGVFNLGFIAANSTAEALRLLRWWGTRLLYDCRAEPERGWFVDQRFVDLFPAFTRDLAIYRTFGANLAYWNLDEGELSKTEEGFFFRNEPLEFFHFSGFDPRRPDRISKYLVDNRVEPESALGQLLSQYAETLMAKGFAAAVGSPLTFDYFPDGRPVPPLLRRLFRERHPGWSSSPFVTFEAAAVALEPLEGTSVAAPRVIAHIWRQSDVRPTLPEEPADQSRALAEWVRRYPAADLADRALLNSLALQVSARP